MKKVIAAAVTLAIALICWAAQCQAAEPLRIDGPATVQVGKVAVYTPVPNPAGASHLWDVSPEDKADVFEIGDGRVVVTGPPGEYRVRLVLLWSSEGKTYTGKATARLTITAGPTPIPPVPVPPAPGKGMGAAAIAQLRVGSSGCTCSAIYPRRADGKWDVLTASHCTSGPGSKGTMKLKDGRSFALTVTVRDTTADITWFVTDQADVADMPYLVLATALPDAGTPVWQAGYGVTQPTVRKDGTFTSGPDSNGQARFKLFVDHGDSGGPMMRADTNEVLAVVCCTKNIGGRGDVWGGCCLVAARLRPSAGPATLEPALPEPSPLPGCGVPEMEREEPQPAMRRRAA